MTLNLNASSPSAYIDADNDSRFVRTFGVIALLGSIFIFIGGGVAIGIGLAVMGFGSGRYYRTLGLAVVILAILGFFLAPFRIIASILLAAGVAWKGKSILNTLALEGKEDADWQVTRKRAITGMVLSIIGVVISFAWLGIFSWIVCHLKCGCVRNAAQQSLAAAARQHASQVALFPQLEC